MVGPRPPRPREQGQTLRDKLTMNQPGRVYDPELQTLNDLIRAGKAFNQERDYRASPNHRPREQIDMYNVAKAFTERTPTMDRGIDDLDVTDLKGKPGLQKASSDVPMRQGDISDLPAEFKDRPKLKYLWLSGQGRLSSKQQKMLDKALEDGHMKLNDDDWVALESLMPTSPVKDMEGPKLDALMKMKVGPQDPYLKGLIADAYRKKEVDRVMEGLRTTSIGLGATFGALFGTSVGPGGTIAGGGLGAAAGSSFIDAVETTTLQILDKIFPNTADMHGTKFTTKEIARRATSEGLIDLGASTAGVYAPFVAKRLKQKILGITKDSTDMAATAGKMGIDMLPLQVGRPLLANATNVLARMPLIGPPIRKRMVEQTAQISSFLDSLPGRVSTKGMKDQDVGVYIDLKAQEMFQKDMQNLTNRQIKVKQAARKMGNFIPMDETSTVAQRWLDHYSQNDFNSTNKNVIKLMNNIVEKSKGGKISIDKWDDDLMAGLRNAADQLEGGEGTKAIMEIMEAARLDLAGSGKFGLQQLAMDRAWEAGLRKYESVAAKKFMLTDRNRFKQGVMKLGTQDPDKLAGLLIGGDSPKFVNDVRGIIGDEAMRELGGVYMKRQIAASYKATEKGHVAIDWDRFEKSLGLSDPKSGRYGVTKEMLRTSGVTMDMLEDFTRVAKKAAETNIPDASTFLSRRVVLGGVAGLGVLLGAMGPQHLGTGIVFTLLARQGAKVISNPENIRLATLALDANADQAVRRSSLMRLYRLLATDRAVDGDQPIDEPAEVSQSGPTMRLPARFNQ